MDKRSWASALLMLLALLLSGGVQAQGVPDPPAADGAATADEAEMQPLDELPGLPPAVLLPEPSEAEVIDLPSDNGRGLGLLWRWVGATTETTMLQVQVKADPAWLDEHRLSEGEKARLDAAAQALQSELSGLVADYDAAAAALAEADAALTLALANRAPDLASVRKERWKAKAAFDLLEQRRAKLRDRLAAQTGKLIEKEARYQYLEAALKAAESNGGWLDTNLGGPAAALTGTKADAPRLFGHDPQEADKLFAEINSLTLPAPPGFEPGANNRYDAPVAGRLSLPLGKGRDYVLRMVVSDGETQQVHELGGATTRVNYFNGAKLNNALMAILFAIIILVAINMARRNPNLFIRRIAGLEAVDEAIGRATEMGKPVLYLNGMTTLADLATLAAINILGRVARRVADFDSALLVPCRDPVVLSVAQEVVREGFIDVGRPDAYREDNIFFVTEDQFSYTASVCAMMVRDKPAANFFMGYYYAESLLLAETGASTGAIQIAGTDSQSQLPFFITACDYTLIGEELYAASAYLSREPMLLGSLKGQDLGKAVIMFIIVVQTLLFAVAQLTGAVASWDWLRVLVTPL